MDKKFLKPLVLGLVFILAVVVFGIVTNKSNTDMTTTMSEASLPVMSFQYGSYEVNELYAYTQEMELTTVRKQIIPVGDDRILTMDMDTDGMEIDAISYEIRSLDGERLMASNQVDFNQKGDNLSAKIKIENIMTLGEEYSLCFTVASGDRKLYYYTRLMETTDSETDICLDFAVEFHNHTLDKNEDGSYFANYVDAATGDTTSFHYVDLTCTARQIMWYGFDVTQVSNLTITIDEITENYNALSLNYVMSSVTSGGEMEYYNVEEYFRLRQGQTQMFVLDYERVTEQIFQSENSFLYADKAIQLGITGPDVEYATDENGSVIAFVQQGELWSYEISENLLAQVFSFRGREGFERRENLQEHGIKIMRVDEAGSIDFIVYGYMNRGSHEGQVGVAVYHYDGLSHNVEEEAFIPSDSSFSVLDCQLGQLMYENDMGQVYLALSGKLYELNLSTLKVKVVVENLSEGCYTASSSNRYFAYVDSKSQNQSSSLHFMDLSTGKDTEIKAESGNYIKPLGFIGEDFIYGLANEGDVQVDAAGTTTFPMKLLRIFSVADGKQELLKEYAPSESYIGGIQVDGYIVQINLISNVEGKYVSSGTDQIMNREADTETVVAISSIATDAKETEYLIAFKGTPGSRATKVITPKEVIATESTKVDLQLDKEETRYYVYVKGRAICATDSISAAILSANANNAVVVDQKQNYVWQRSRSIYRDPMNGLHAMEADAAGDTITKAISVILAREEASVSVSDMIQKGYTPKEVLEMSLKDYQVLDLTSCTVDEMLYYVNRGTPVFALTGAESAVLLTGYTSNLIYYYDPASASTLSMSIADANTLFYNAGNVFFTYLK